MDDPAQAAALRRLPAVGALLEQPDLNSLIWEHGRILVTRAIRDALSFARTQIRAGHPATVTRGEVERALDALTRRSLRHVINATGVVLHTNLGRAPLADTARMAVASIAGGYSSLEMYLEDGVRGDRHAHTDALIADLLGTDGGLAFNNCAGATFLMLAALCRGREVIVARGELVEIGGGFRIPDVLAESGATLVEVGTTNKVYARDYEAAITERTGAILRVHRSNFALVGFTAQPSLPELSAVARKHDVALLVDQGSGLIADPKDLGDAAAAMADEPRPQDVLAQGADLVAFSGDKLLGGPQAGILAGREAMLAVARKHPLARALRADKLTIAALEATLRLYRDGRAREIPVIGDLSASAAVLQMRATNLARILESTVPLTVEIVDGESVPGGGSLPLCHLPTRLVLVGESGPAGRRLAEALRRGEPPIVTRMVDDRVALDVRTLRDNELARIAARFNEMAELAPAAEEAKETG